MSVKFPSSFRPVEQSTESTQASNFPSSFKPIENKKKGYFEAPEYATQVAIGAAEGALGGPGSIGEFVNSIIDKLPKGEESSKLRRMATKFLFPQLGGPDIQKIEEQEKKTFGEKLQPTTGAGRIGRRTGQFGGAALTTAGGAAGVGLGAISGATGQGIREAGLPEEVAIAAELISPLAVKGAGKIILPHTEGTLRNSLNASQKIFYDEAKNLGLSDQEITPLLQSERRIKMLGPFAKKTEQASKAIKESREATGQIYEPIKQKASQLGPLSSKQNSNLLSGLNKVLINLEKTPSPSEDKQKAITFLKNAVKNISENGSSPEELINFFQDINEMRLYEHLKPAKNIIKNSISSADSKLGREFEFTNQMYSKLSNLKKSMGIGEWENLVSFGERAAFLAFLGKGLLFGGGFGVAASILGEALARRVATKMLIDPRWQGILRNTMKAAQKNSRGAALTAYGQLKEQIKEDFPEEYDKIDWPKD